MKVQFGADPGINTWSSGDSISSGQFYVFEDNLYQANETHIAGETFDSSKFDVIGDFNTSSELEVSDSTPVTITTGTSSVAVDASSGNAEIGLYTAVGNKGKKVDVRKTDSSTNTVTIDAYDTETINGETTLVLSVENETVTLISDGTNWYVANNTAYNEYQRIVIGTTEPDDTSVLWYDTN